VLVPLTDHVALVSLTPDIPTRLVLQAAAAIQKQITRDFTPYWGLRVTVDAFEDLESVPSDYHPIVLFAASDELVRKLEYAVGEERTAEIVDDFERDRVSGLHMNSFTRQPFALVAANDTWSVTLSHETLEMVTDPFGNRLVAAAHPFDARRRVRYLLEVCDPCQAVWYPVNGVPVSDFYCPRYFDPVLPDRDRYSFTGAIEHPLQILEGGYLTWIDPGDSALYQLGAGDTVETQVADLDALKFSTAALRTIVDTSPLTPQLTREQLRPANTAFTASGTVAAVEEASRGTALRVAQAVRSLAAEGGGGEAPRRSGRRDSGRRA
jgi:hypothetical protein